MAAAWARDNLEDGPTSLLRGIVSLTSTRLQDRAQLHWLTGNQFPNYLAAVGLVSGTQAISAVLGFVIAQRSESGSQLLNALGVDGRLLDSAPGLDYGPDHDVPATIVNAYLDAVDDALEDQEVERAVAAMVTDIKHPEFWARLLTAGGGLANWRRPLLATLESGALLANSFTRAAAGELLRVVAPALSSEEHAHLVEQPIKNAARLFQPGQEKWRDRCLDQCLGFLDPDRVEDPELLTRLRALLAEEGPPPVPQRPPLVTDPDLVDVALIGEAVRLVEPAAAAQTPLAELEALINTGPDDGMTAVARLGETFGRAEVSGARRSRAVSCSPVRPND